MKIKLGSVLDNKRFLAVFSLLMGAVLWLVVGVVDVTEVDTYIRDVPVTISTQFQTLTDRNLSVIVDSEHYVNVKVRGPRTVLGSVKPQDFVITPRLTGVTSSGTYDLDLSVATGSPIENIKDVTVVSISPSTIKLRFDSIATRAFTIEPVGGISTEAGYISDPERVTPKQIVVTGPEADLEKIDKAIVSYDLSEPLSRTLSLDLPIQLLDAQGNEISVDSRHLVLDQIEAQLLVNVRKLKTLPLIVEFTTPPIGFPLDELEAVMTMSDYEITVAGPVDTTDNYTEQNLGYIDLSTLSIENNTFSFEVNLPTTGFTNVDNINNVIVSFVTQDWDTNTYNIKLTDEAMSNIPPRYDVKLMTTSLSNVVMVGDVDVINGLTADDIVVTMDLAGRQLKPGQFNYPVKISAPTKGLVWAVGEYSAIIQVTEKTA